MDYQRKPRLTPNEIRLLALIGFAGAIAASVLIGVNIGLSRSVAGGGEFYSAWNGARMFLFSHVNPYNLAVAHQSEQLAYGHAAGGGQDPYYLTVPFFLLPIYFPFAFISDTLFVLFPSRFVVDPTVVRGLWLLLNEGALLVTALLLAIGDQSRLQPWFYQYLVMFGAIFFAETHALDICRLLVACTYFWSGLQKLNPEFRVNIFPAVADPLMRVFPRWHPAIPALAIATALAEAAIGVGLLWRRTRRVSVIAAIAMHVLLLAELGPLGRNFNQVVWPWNVSMILFDVILFWRADFRIADPWWRAGAYGKLVVLLAVVMPAFSLFGLWDSYLSFALYAGNMKTGIIYMTDAMADRLPDDLQDIIYVTSKLGIDELDENDWSYAAVGTPAYSQDRIFRSAARALCRYEQNPRELTLVVEGRRQFIGQPSHAVYSCSDLR